MISLWNTALWKMRQLFQQHSVRLLTACVLLLLVKVLLLQMRPNFYRRFLSFRYTHFYEMPSYKELRDARNFLNSWPTIQPKHPTPDLVITVVTVFRDKVPQQYIHYTLQTLLLGLDSELRSGSVKVILCSGDRIPGRDEYLKQLRQHFLVLKPTGVTRAPIVVNKKDNSWRFEKERQDYVFCLNETLTRLPSVGHLLVLEDDAPIRLSGAPFFTTLRHFIDQAGQRGIRRFAFIKLYHPPRLLGYLQPEWDRHLEGLAIVGIFITMLKLIQFGWPSVGLWSRMETIMSQRYMVVCLLLLLYTVDRYWLLELRSLSKYFHLMVPAPFCCTPGILFQRQSAVEAMHFIDRTRSTNRYGKDAALYDYYRNSGLPAWYIQPNLVQHIGRKSTLHPHVIASTSL